MASSIRILLSLARIAMVCWCISGNLAIVIRSIPFIIMFLLITLQFLIICCISTLRNIDYHRGLKRDVVSFGSYWLITFIHIILCIKLTKSEVLDRLMDMQLNPKFYILQLLLHLYQVLFPFLLFSNNMFANIEIIVCLCLCAAEALVVVGILLKKTNSWNKPQVRSQW